MNPYTISIIITNVIIALVSILIGHLFTLLFKKKITSDDSGNWSFYYGLKFLVILVVYLILFVVSYNNDSVYQKVSEKTMFWTTSYKQEIVRDSVLGSWNTYRDQWNQLYTHLKNLEYSTTEYNKIDEKMDSIHALMDSTMKVYEQLPD